MIPRQIKQNLIAMTERTAERAPEQLLNRTITIRLSSSGLIIALILVLFAGIAIGSLVVNKASATPQPQEVHPLNQNSANSLSAAFANATKNVETSVVRITTVDFDSDADALSKSSGSGFIVDPLGYIVTNYHVVRDASKIKVHLYDGSILSGTFVGADEDTDVAVIKIASGTPLKAARIGDSDSLVVGDWVIAIGSPFGLEQTVTAGIISAKERVTDANRNFQQFLQTDAAINPGNSGGPLVNMAGEIIGINSRIASQGGNFEGIGFAVPSSIFTNVYSQLLATGRVSRGFLGVSPTKVTPQFAQIYKLPEVTGALVHDLTDTEGPAAKAHLQSGDVIVEFNNHQIKDDRDLVRYIVTAPINTPINTKFFREGKLKTVNVYLVERESKAVPIRPRPIVEAKPKFGRGNDHDIEQKVGMETATLTEPRAQQLGYKSISGVIVRTVTIDNVAYDAGLRDSDLIREANKLSITKQEEFTQAINKLKSGDPLVFFIERRSRLGTSHRYISLTVP